MAAILAPKSYIVVTQNVKFPEMSNNINSLTLSR